MDYIIREAKIEDCHELSYLKLVIWNQVYIDIYPKYKFDNYNYENEEKKFEKILNNKEVKLFVVESNNKILGYMSCGSPIRKFMDYKQEIGLLYLEEQLKYKGIGKILFNKAYNIIKNNGYDEFFISCNKYNINARKFYEKMGGKLIHVDEDNLDKSLPQVKYLYSIK